MIQVEDEKMIFLDANAFYSYYGRSKLGMTSEPVDEKRLKKYLDQQSEKSLPTSVYIEIMTHFRNNPKVLQSLLEFRYAKGLPLFNNIPDYVVSEDEITSVAYMDQVALKNYADRLLKSKIQIESKFTLLFFEITKDLYAHYKLEMTDGLSKKNKDAILGYIGRVAYKEYQNLLEERIKEELQSGYDENKEKKVLKDFYIQELNEACVLTNIIIQGSNGDLLLTKDGTIGKVAYISDLNRPATLNSGVFVVKPITDAYTAHFMFYVLESSVFKEFLQQLSAGSTINHLYQKDLVKFDLYVPPTTEEQEAIAGILFDMDLDIYKLEEKLSKYQKIKLGMMDELLTGKVRLV